MVMRYEIRAGPLSVRSVLSKRASIEVMVQAGAAGFARYNEGWSREERCQNL